MTTNTNTNTDVDDGLSRRAKNELMVRMKVVMSDLEEGAFEHTNCSIGSIGRLTFLLVRMAIKASVEVVEDNDSPSSLLVLLSELVFGENSSSRIISIQVRDNSFDELCVTCELCFEDQLKIPAEKPL